MFPVVDMGCDVIVVAFDKCRRAKLALRAVARTSVLPLVVWAFLENMGVKLAASWQIHSCTFSAQPCTVVLRVLHSGKLHSHVPSSFMPSPSVLSSIISSSRKGIKFDTNAATSTAQKIASSSYFSNDLALKELIFKLCSTLTPAFTTTLSIL